MTVKSTVSFTDRHHEFAQKKVKEGVYASVSSLVAAGIEQVIRDDAEREAALEAMKKMIQKRMETPKEQWIEMKKDNNEIFDKAKKTLISK